MNIMDWFDPSFLDETISWLDHDLLDVFGLKPEYVQFSLVFLFMLSLMWVVKPVIEWMMLNHWKTLSSYVTSTLLALVFLQLVDRYAMSDTTSTLPASYWSVCLLAISSFGLVYVTMRWMRKLYARLSKRSKRKAA
ncbi:hypothetical protein [Halobacillus faecis]|uniref:Uncharacterized protein n=1 Tax=Halobacillus faecis TaxID=360184 RepID=A0A511WT44_9BACI|nr:hypothetical protein [Halobacillus faecis]GEN52452.1 hypothetical protein HFA01_07140 [Halobacillus faecis]